LAEIEEMVIRAEAAVAVSSAALNLAMGRELGTPVEPVTELEPAPAAEESLEALVDEALAARPDLAATAAQVAAAERQVAAARAQRLPEVGFMGAVEAHGEDHPFAADGDNWSLGVGLRWTAFDGLATGARIRRAEESRRQAEQLATFELQRAALEVRRAYHELAAAGKRIEQAERAVELAAASLKIVEDRYENGLATLVELLEAETSLTEAKSRRVATRRDLLIAQATLDLAVGRL
jgi:outer membrane protein TolC